MVQTFSLSCEMHLIDCLQATYIQQWLSRHLKCINKFLVLNKP